MSTAIAHDEAALAEHSRRKVMAALCVTPGCRTRRLLAAFGEDSAPCGTCDVCRSGLLTLRLRLSAPALGLRAALERRVKSHLDRGADLAPDDDAPASNAAQQFAPEPPLESMLRVGDERLLRELLALQRLVLRAGSPAFAEEDAEALSAADRDAFLRAVENSRQQ